MTKETFQDKIKSIYKSDNITNYVMAGLLLAMGVFLIIKFIISPPAIQYTAQRYMIWIIPCIPTFVALYVFWRIPKDYIVYEMKSSKPIEEKLNLIENYLLDAKVVRRYEEGNYRSYTYRNNLFRKVDLRLYIDEKKVLFNVQGTDSYGRKGVIDFGLTRRAGRRFRKYLEEGLL